jgi:putative salt-induced outer membrane protein YdiY
MASGTRAETVVMKNSDHLTGTITHSDGKKLTLHTDYAGDITMDWSAVTEVTSEKTLFVVTPDKKTISGTITTADSGLLVHTASAGDVRVPLNDVAIVRSTEEQDAYEKSLHPGFRDNWKGNVNLGFALSRGDNSTSSFTTGWNADRKTLSDHVAIYASSLYSKTNASGVSEISANSVLGGIRYDKNFTERMFAFGAGDFSHDALQDLDLQSIYTVGVGAHIVNHPTTTLDVSGGPNYTREVYGGQPIRNSAGATVGEDYSHQIGKLVALNEHFYFYPDLSNRGQYRFSFDGGSVTKISRWLAWQVTISDRFISNPPALGIVRNSFIVSTGFNVSFGQ